MTSEERGKFKTAVGRVIRLTRLSRGMSVVKVSENTGISSAHLYRVETGVRGLRDYQLMLVAEALGVKSGELMDRIVARYTGEASKPR